MRIITHRHHLDLLPAGSVVRDSYGLVFTAHHLRHCELIVWAGGADGVLPTERLALPVVVLWNPSLDRVVTTPDELAELDDLTTIVDADGCLFTADAARAEAGRQTFGDRYPGRWFTPGDPHPYTDEQIVLPALVIDTPEEA